MIIQVFFGSAQTSVGYQFYDSTGSLLGTRITAGITSGAEIGHYVASATIPSGASGVFWDSSTTEASEDLRDSILLENKLTKDLREVTALIESQRGGHAVQGNVYFVDPVNGDTHANGARGGADDPYSLIQDAHDNAVVDSNHDMIWLVSGSSGGTTVANENVTISKRYCQVRGPGRDFIILGSGNAPTFAITADGIQMSGMRVQAAGSGSAARGILATSADYFGTKRIWVEETDADGIRLVDCKNAMVAQSNFQNCGLASGDSISIRAGTGQNSSFCKVLENFIENSGSDGIVLDTTGSGSILSTVIKKNNIFKSSGAAVNIVDANTLDTVVTENRFAGNALDFTNNGVGTTYIDNEPIQDSVWLDTVNGDDGDPGLPSQPVQTITRAKAIADDLNNRISVINGSSFTLDDDFSDYYFLGNSYAVNLGGQNISNSYFAHATISGIGTATTPPEFFHCDIETVTLPPAVFVECRHSGTLTFGSSGTWKFDESRSSIAGVAAPILDANSTGSNSINVSGWSRGITVNGLTATDTATLNGVFNTITLNGADATVNVSGQYGTLVDNLTGTPSVSITNAFKSGDIASILTDTDALPTAAEIDTELTASHGSGPWSSSNGGSGARTITFLVNDGTTPLESAKVRMTKGLESYIQQTDANGNCTFNLDDGTWTVAATLPGYSFTGSSLVITTDATPTISLTAVTVAPPADPNLATLFVNTQDIIGQPVSGLVITVRLPKVPTESGGGNAIANANITMTDNGGGNYTATVERTDGMTPLSSYYLVNSAELGILDCRLVVDAPTKDLADLA